MTAKYIYQGKEVTFLGQMGESIFEIQDNSSGDPQRCINRGRPFTVARTQVEIKEIPNPQPVVEAIAKQRKKAESN